MQVHLNKHYLAFYVVTKFYIQVIDAKTGVKIKKYDKVVDMDGGKEIIDFCFDSTHRKFFIGDTDGMVKCFNAGNGLLIKEETLRPAATKSLQRY